MSRPMLSTPSGWPWGGEPSLVVRSAAAMLEGAMVSLATAEAGKDGAAPLMRAQPYSLIIPLVESLGAFVDSDDPAGFLRARRGH